LVNSFAAHGPAGGIMYQAIIERWLAAWSGANLDDLSTFVASDFVRYSPPSFNQVTHSLAEIKEVISGYRTAFPDAQITLGEIVCQDDKAFYRWTQTGTNTGPGDFPPTGKTMHVTGVCFARFRDGKMMEKYHVEDLNLDAGGGEYPVQDGFGWTNGVYLALKKMPF
jgi:steroid delta-isomerase-like uncharacterized protein